MSVDRGTGAARIMRQGTLFNNPLGVTTVVNRPPSAAISFAPQRVRAGQRVTYDASGSADPEGLGLRYAWDLDGNGSFELTTGSAPRATTSFNQSTTMTPRVHVLDPHGGEAVAAASSALVVDTIRPVIGGFRASSRTIATSAGASAAARRKSVRFRFRLSESARVRIAIERAVAGRRKGGRCVAPGKARRSAKRCTRWHRADHAPQAGQERAEQRALLRQGPRAGAARRPLPRTRHREGRRRQLVAGPQGRLQRGARAALEVHAPQ